MSTGYADVMARVLISMSDELLERVDREAERCGVTRSAFLRTAAQRELGWPDPAVLDPLVEAGQAVVRDRLPESCGGYELPGLRAGGFLALDVRASSALTRELVGWQPTHPRLIDDLERGHYFGESPA